MTKSIITFITKTMITAIISISAFLSVMGAPIESLHNIADYKFLSKDELLVAYDKGYESGYEKGVADGRKPSDNNGTKKSPATSEYPKTMYVKDQEGLNLREGPGTGYTVIASLKYSQAIQVDMMESGWAHTTVNGRSGWCSADYLSSIANPPENRSTKMVWISSTGECYHCDPDCSNMDDPDYIEESDAISLGRRKCSKCF